MGAEERKPMVKMAIRELVVVTKPLHQRTC